MSQPDLEAANPASLLDDVRIASPCKASWDDMVGDDRVRFCGQCSKNVYNLSALSRDAAEVLLRDAGARSSAKGEGVCVRLYRRADGTVLTADCPEGVRRKRRRLALFSAVGGGLMAAGAAVAAAEHPRPPMQGAVATTFQGGPTMGAPLPAAGRPATTVQTTPVPPASTTTAGLEAIPPPPVAAPPVPKKHGHWTGGAIRPSVQPGPTTPIMGDYAAPEPLMGKIKQGPP